MEDLIIDYQNKIKLKTLQEKYNISYKKLIKLLKEKNVYVKFNTQTFNNNYNETFIRNNYGKIETKSILKTLNVSPAYLYSVLKREKIDLIGSGTIIRNKIDEIDFDSNWFNYFLGWAESDGNVMFKKGIYSYTLTSKDKEIIDLFKNYIPDSKIYFKEKEEIYYLRVNHKNFVKKLISLGITPNKANSIKMKNYSFNNHFVRGVFDGDGSVRNINLSKKYEAKITSGSIEFVKQLREFLEENNIKTSVYKNGKCYNITTTNKKSTFEFYKFLYKDCDNLFLKRKYLKFAAMFSDEH